MYGKLTLIFLVFIGLVNCRRSGGLFSANVVEDLVRNEVERKMPSAVHTKTMTGVHLKEATDAINKLVDESIVDRVQEAEREVSKMLLKSIEHHIQDAGKALLKNEEDSCKDRIDGCKELANSNVCETSKDAMIVNCPHTCNFCGLLDELKNDQQEVTKKKKKHRKRKRKHRKSPKLKVTEANLIHQNMLDQTIDNSNLPMAVDNSPAEQQQQQQVSTTQVQTPEEDQQQAADDNAQQEADAEDAKKQEEEEEAERQRAEEKRRRKKKKAKLHKQQVAALAAATKADKGEDYFTSHCHPLCAKECISSCAPGCCDHRVAESIKHAKNKRRCHPMCKKICLPSCGKDCCAPGVQPMPPPQEGMCPPGCPLQCAPSCLDSCCSPGAVQAPPPPPPQPAPVAPVMATGSCFGSCINSCESNCPPQCCPSYTDTTMICNAQCPANCAPLCTPECCGATMPISLIPAEPVTTSAPTVAPKKDETERVPTLPVAGPMPAPFDSCPGACPTSCAPGCEFDCCRPFLDPNIVQEMRSEQPSTGEASAAAVPAPPAMTRVIHVSRVLRPQNGAPATCPEECKQHCNPACAKEGCCTDRKRKRNHIAKNKRRSHIPAMPRYERAYENIYDREYNVQPYYYDEYDTEY